MSSYKTFNYACPTCQHAEEIFSRDHDSEKLCPRCQTVMNKQLTMPTFILRGVGCFSNGTYARAKDGPKLDQDLLKLSDRELNVECGLPPDCM
jgi:putative FmdB family regulatory protein